jgi:hypothetical protein
MQLRTRLLALTAAIATITLASFGAGLAAPASRDQLPPWPNDLSTMGAHAAIASGADASQFEGLISRDAIDAIQRFYAETKTLGVPKRVGTLFVPGPTNVRANNPAGDRIGETQGEVAVCVFGDTVVIGWNDSRGFLAGGGTGSPGPPTISSSAYSTDGGATFIDLGDMPLAAAGDQAFGDPGIDTDEKGNWYYNQIYTRTTVPAQQNIAVHRGVFTAGVLAWGIPVQASIGTAATGFLDKCLLGCDRVTGNVYVSYTRFTATPQIEIVRSTTQGATWGAAIVLDATVVPTASKQAARPFCGPGGEVYVVWEKGANLINCPDGLGNVTNTTGQIAFSRSLDFGATYSPLSVIGTVEHSWTWSGPGDLRERANEFPDIAVDVSTNCYRGNIYVTWHESAPWTANLSAGPVTAEANDAANNNPTGPELFTVGDDCTGTVNAAADLDYWQFSATQGQSLLFNLDPSTFNCGVTGTAASMRMRLFAVTTPFPNPTGFPDSILAASALGAFADRIVWTCPATGNYLIRLQRAGAGTAAPYTYRMRVRALTFGAPSPGRDGRDVVIVRSSNQGTTWSAEQLINDDLRGLENRRPFVTVNNKGHVAAYWHDSRDAGMSSTASLTQIYGTTSRDGGATWSPNYCVTDEESFFSFNTIGVPNLGDYNQASAGGTDVFHPAWSDQRISSGDVRTPGTNTYTAGRGPDAYTTGIRYLSSIKCPDDLVAAPGSSVVLNFQINNTGNITDTYSYSITDNNGYIGGPVNGNAGPVPPGGSSSIQVKVNVPANCVPAQDLVTFSYTPAGEGCLAAQMCQTMVQCDVGTATLIANFVAAQAGPGVDLTWFSDAVDEVQSWNVYRAASANGGYVRLNGVPIAMLSGGEFRFHDDAPLAGAAYYRLAAVSADGSERTVATTRVGAAEPFSFALAGKNPIVAGAASLRYTLPAATHVRIDVYNVSGQRVRTLVDRSEGAGAHSVDFALGRGALTPGVYMVRISAGKDQQMLRVVALE